MHHLMMFAKFQISSSINTQAAQINRVCMGMLLQKKKRSIFMSCLGIYLFIHLFNLFYLCLIIYLFTASL